MRSRSLLVVSALGIVIGCEKPVSPSRTDVVGGADPGDHQSPGKSCLVETGCPGQHKRLPDCTDELEESAMDAGMVKVRGMLVLSGIYSTEALCSPKFPCCNWISSELMILGPRPVELGAKCSGDISAVCCPFDGLGDEVIAIGRLVRNPTKKHDLLMDPRICKLPPPSPKR